MAFYFFEIWILFILIQIGVREFYWFAMPFIFLGKLDKKENLLKKILIEMRNICFIRSLGEYHIG